MSTVLEVAHHLDMTEQGARKLQQQGVLPRGGRGNLDLDECRERYIEHLRRPLKQGVRHEYDSEKTRLAKEQADREAMRNARERASLVPHAEATAALGGFIEHAKSRLMRVPAKVARGDLKLQQRIADGIADALLDLAPARVQDELGAGIEVDEDESDA